MVGLPGKGAAQSRLRGSPDTAALSGHDHVPDPIAHEGARSMTTAHDHDWTKPKAVAIPKEGYYELQQGRYGPIFPQTPANYGFSILAKVKPGREQAVRDYGKTITEAVAASQHWRR
jgi:hypothetical protein